MKKSALKRTSTKTDPKDDQNEYDIKILAISKGYYDGWELQYYDVIVANLDSYDHYLIYSGDTKATLIYEYEKSYFADYYDFIDSNYWRNPKLFWLKKPVTIEDLTFDEIHKLRREIWGQLSVDRD
jgi:hypothetical protein